MNEARGGWRERRGAPERVSLRCADRIVYSLLPYLGDDEAQIYAQIVRGRTEVVYVVGGGCGTLLDGVCGKTKTHGPWLPIVSIRGGHTETQSN